MAIDKGENCCQVLSQGALLLLQPLRGLINALLWIGLSFRPLAKGTSRTSFYILKKNPSSTGIFCVMKGLEN